MFIVTGGAGFIGSAVVWKLNAEGIDDILVVDRLGETEKWRNLVPLRFRDYLHKDRFLERVVEDRVPLPVEGVIHMGACSSTTERDGDYLMENNFHYSCRLAEWAVSKGVPMIYASSAATYGDGSLGFSDDDGLSGRLRPLNLYGYSKQLFDLWVLRKGWEDRLAGLRFFNVFGPNEFHKGEMRSVVLKSFEQIRDTGKVRLFRSHRPAWGDGDQMRDFVYVKDAVEVVWWLAQHREIRGIFNVGTGKARTWNDLVKAVFRAAGRTPSIEYVEMPGSIREQYQYFTEAKMEKLARAGCPLSFRSLEDSVADYVAGHLLAGDPYLK
jgi:ADP-L-glycero-D-manno-heptose 6-epimerase